MKILLSFLQDQAAAPHDIPAYRFWSYYIKNGIAEANMQFVEVEGVDWAAGLIHDEQSPALEQWKDEVWSKTLNYLKMGDTGVDIVLCYLYPKQIAVSAIREIRKLGIPCVNFYCDNIREFTRVPEEFKAFDLVWVPELEALPMYKKAKVDYINLPMPIWIDHRYRVLPTSENERVTFIGSKDVLRQRFFSGVIARGLDIGIGGKGWDTVSGKTSAGPSTTTKKFKNALGFIKRHGIKGYAAYAANRVRKLPQSVIPPENILGQPDFEAYLRITRESRITLGFNEVPIPSRLDTRPLVYSRLRDLEAPMLGACYLTEYTEGLDYLYEIGKEIETYANADELIEKCRELIASKSKRTLLRTQGQQRALNSHNIPTSLEKIKLKLFK